MRMSATLVKLLIKPLKTVFTGAIALQKLGHEQVSSKRITRGQFKRYRTVKSMLPFKELADIYGTENEVVGPEGLEPPTRRV